MKFYPILITTLSAFSVAIVSTTVSALLTMLFAIRRFRFEQRWARQADAYERILIALSAMKEYLDRSFEALITRTTMPSSVKDDLNKQATEGYKDLRTCLVLSGFLLSIAARDRLNQFFRELDQVRNGYPYNRHDMFGQIESEGAAVDKCIEDLQQLAFEDLKLQKKR